MVLMAKCTDSKTEWASLILTIITINVTWWLLNIPVIQKQSFSQYKDMVLWTCFRLYMPAVVAITAIVTARTPQEQAYIYYSGPFYDTLNRKSTDRGDVSYRLSKFQLVRYLVMDTISIAATIHTVITDIKAPAYYDTSPDAGSFEYDFRTTSWVFPSLPAAIIGLWLLLCSHLSWNSWWTVGLGILLLIAVGAAVTVPLLLLAPNENVGVVFLTFTAYAWTALPLAGFNRVAIVMFCISSILFSRVGVISGSVVLGYFPFCPLKSWVFGLTYFAVGSVSAVLAWYGRQKFYPSIGLIRCIRELGRKRPVADQQTELCQNLE